MKMSEMRRYIAQRIRLLRELKRRTIQQFADDLGVSRTAINHWEADGGMSLDRLDEIAARYDIPVTWFLPPKHPPRVDPGFRGMPLFEDDIVGSILRDWQSLVAERPS